MLSSSGITIALVAHVIIALSLVWDKILLQNKQTENVVGYVFWFGILSIFGPFLAFAGIHLPSWQAIFLALVGGGIYLVSNYFYFAALKRGESSQTVAMMGGLSPVATALIGLPLLGNFIGGQGLWGFVLMVAGSFCMCFSENIRVGHVLPFALLSAVFFGLTNVLQKLAFDQAGFLAGYVFFTSGTFVASFFFLLRRAWREQIVAQAQSIGTRNKISYLSNRCVERVGSLLLFLAISRANPAIVDALAAVRYVIIFFCVYLLTQYRPQWLSESFRGRTLTVKLIATVLVIAGVVLLGWADHAKSNSH